jgi:hypothetical protein
MNMIKLQSKLSNMALSSNSLPSFLVHTIVDQTQLKNVIEEHKKRISSARKIYSNMERDKIKLITKDAETTARPISVNKSTSLNVRRIRSADLLIEKSKKTSQQATRVVKAEKDEKENSVASKREEAIRIDYINKMNSLVKKDSDFKIKKSAEKRPKKLAVVRNEKTSMTNLKPRETNLDRYIKYLKQLLKEKAGQFKLDLPLLCQCNINSHLAVWDIDWNKCANNCLFYKNPKGKFYFILLLVISK